MVSNRTTQSTTSHPPTQGHHRAEHQRAERPERNWRRAGSLLLLAVVFALVPATAWAQPEGGAVIVERKQSYYLGELKVWSSGEGRIAVQGHMSPLFEMEMTVLNVTPSKVAKGIKAEKGNWNGTIGEPISIATELRGALPVLVRMNYRKLDRIDTKRQFHRIRIQEIPSHEQGAVFVECHLADDEEVRCSQTPSTRPGPGS